MQSLLAALIMASVSLFVLQMADHFGVRRIKGFVCLAHTPTVRGVNPLSLKAIDRLVFILAGEADTEAPFDQCAH